MRRALIGAVLAWEAMMVLAVLVLRQPAPEQVAFADEHRAARAMFNAGDALFRRGRTDEALPYFWTVHTTCPIKSPVFTVATVKLAICYEARGDWRKAAEMHRLAAEWGMFAGKVQTMCWSQNAREARTEAGVWRVVRKHMGERT